MQTIITVWPQSFAKLLLLSVGLCVLAILSLKYLFGCRRLLLLLHIFVVDEMVKVTDSKQSGTEEWQHITWKKGLSILQHHSFTHMKSFNCCCGPVNPYQVNSFHHTGWSHSLTGIGWFAWKAFLAQVLKIINGRSLITITGRWDMKLSSQLLFIE